MGGRPCLVLLLLLGLAKLSQGSSDINKQDVEGSEAKNDLDAAMNTNVRTVREAGKKKKTVKKKKGKKDKTKSKKSLKKEKRGSKRGNRKPGKSKSKADNRANRKKKQKPGKNGSKK